MGPRSHREEDLSAQQSEAETGSRFPQADVHQGWAQHPESSPVEGPQEAQRLIPTRGSVQTVAETGDQSIPAPHDSRREFRREELR